VPDSNGYTYSKALGKYPFRSKWLCISLGTSDPLECVSD
jgi:hypothetical protein